ncbi:polyhydroxyalkanoate depolymerase [Paracoccus sediminicola]|uniref:polyhydroxyalkanoate depolymerase n=1 Tax=Paracoccus sediminicola TaxID=3017783 RepID=UPI003EB8AD12
MAKQPLLKGLISYDVMESIRNTNEWLGASARAMASYPAFAMIPHPMFRLMSAWGHVTERSFSRMVIKPDWNIPAIAGPDGQDHVVYVDKELKADFGDLIHFRVARREPMARKILLVAPMSGHYATLLRSTVTSLLPDAEVYVTDWHNARDIPVSKGKFDIEDYTQYLADFMRHLGPDLNVIAVCQPAPLALAATAMLAETEPKAQPKTLTLIGGPINPDAAATEVTDFGNRITMGELEYHVIQQVGFKYPGTGRLVYPGLAQLASFISMNAETHTKAFMDKILADARGEGSESDRHNKFYDEYLAVMDMTAEFYLSTVERIFKGLEIAENRFTVNGKQVDIGKITDVAIMTVEGGKDDISAPGQCVAALDLCTGVPEQKKQQHLEEDAGHYGIFAGRSWRLNIRPLVLDFIDEQLEGPQEAPSKPRRRRGGKNGDGALPGIADDDRKMPV